MTDLLVTPDLDRRPLLRYVPRLCRWTVLLGGITVAWGVTWWRAEGITNELVTVWTLRLLIVVGCVTATFALDDPSRDVTESTLGARRELMASRLLVAVAVVMMAVVPAAIVLRGHLTGLVAWGMLLEAVTVLAVLASLALTLQRRWHILEPAQFVVLSVPLLAAADSVTGGRWPLLVGPGSEWDQAHARWGAVAVVAAALCLWQLRDPASRPLLPRRHAA